MQVVVGFVEYSHEDQPFFGKGQGYDLVSSVWICRSMDVYDAFGNQTTAGSKVWVFFPYSCFVWPVSTEFSCLGSRSAQCSGVSAPLRSECSAKGQGS